MTFLNRMQIKASTFQIWWSYQIIEEADQKLTEWKSWWFWLNSVPVFTAVHPLYRFELYSLHFLLRLWAVKMECMLKFKAFYLIEYQSIKVFHDVVCFSHGWSAIVGELVFVVWEPMFSQFCWISPLLLENQTFEHLSCMTTFKLTSVLGTAMGCQLPSFQSLLYFPSYHWGNSLSFHYCFSQVSWRLILLLLLTTFFSGSHWNWVIQRMFWL